MFFSDVAVDVPIVLNYEGLNTPDDNAEILKMNDLVIIVNNTRSGSDFDTVSSYLVSENNVGPVDGIDSEVLGLVYNDIHTISSNSVIENDLRPVCVFDY